MTSALLRPPPDAPIGVFDSGVGGLDVAAELTLTLPSERLIYLGDSARVPYGTRTPEEVKRFTEEAILTLVERGVKAVVLACNTASAWALEELSERYSLPILGMIEAGVEAAEAVERQLPIGSPRGVLILATPRTIDAQAYQRRFMGARGFVDAPMYALACPVFVPLVEAGWAEHEISALSAQLYLEELISRRGDQVKEEVGVALLGCTHYPLLRASIIKGFSRVLGREVSVVDGAHRVGLQLKDRLSALGALSPQHEPVSSEEHVILMTGDPSISQPLAERFWRARLGRPLPPMRQITITG